VRYRSDIDGLRAIAVLPVVGFHAGLPGLSGGFVGVDVFFVISGYLIGSLILQELKAGTFTFSNFYYRRFKRILPALIFMLAVTTVAGLFVLYPARLAEFGRSLAAASLSVANIYFWLTSGYFDAPAATKPLLHTWSLAVEEQFYIVLPPLLMAARGLSLGGRRGLLWMLAAASFVASVIGVYAAPQSTFYLLHTRAWELLLGTLVGMYAPPAMRAVREGMALSGLAMIAGSVLVFKEGMHFPGLAAVPPCLGAALIIWSGAGGQTVVGRFLSLKPLTFIGLISYSLYLWHCPIIVLYKQQVLHPVALADQALMIGGALLLATVSWKYVERPFRAPTLSPKLIFTTSAAGTAALTVAALCLVQMRGLPERFSPAVNLVSSYLDYDGEEQLRSGVCLIGSGYTFADFDKTTCLRHDLRKKNVVLLGDSHAAHLYHGLRKQLPDASISQATASGCRATLRHNASDSARCTDLMDYMFDTYLPAKKPDLLLLAGRWTDRDLPRLAETIDWAKTHGIPVALSGPIVEYDAALPFLLAKSLRGDRSDVLAKHRAEGPEQRDKAYEALARSKGVPYVSTYRALCGVRACVTRTASGIPVQFDYGHLTKEGSELVVAAFVKSGLFARQGFASPAAGL
jgi:peptidoglycan/LPS O-acetylase OafA/YrhL